MISSKERKFIINRAKFAIGDCIQVHYKNTNYMYKITGINGSNTYSVQYIKQRGDRVYFNDTYKTYSISYFDKFGSKINLDTMVLLYG